MSEAPPGTIVAPTGDVFAVRCACPLHPQTGHAARPMGHVAPPPVETTPPPVETGGGRGTRSSGGNATKGDQGPTYTGGMTERGTRRRRRTYRPRAAAFVDLASRRGTTDAGHDFKVREGAEFAVAPLLRSVPAEVERVFLLGPRPGGTLEGLYEWAGGAGRKWRESGAGHYIENPELPVLRYENDGDDGATRKLEIHRLKAWFGDTPTTPAAARDGMALVAKLIGAGFAGGTLLATPATTGRDLFLRTVPAGREWPVLDDETQELIRSTTGQGRIELFPHAGELPRLVELDGRFMYGALCWGLGSGPAQRTTARGDELLTELHSDRRALYRPARYRVSVTVPKGWDRLGLLGVMTDGKSRGWEYPSHPGRKFETWCDGSELFVVLRHGWAVKVRERVAFHQEPRGPLDTWARTIGNLWRDLWPDDDEPPGSARNLARIGLRNLVLHSLGAFVGRSHVVTRSVAVKDATAVPADAINLREESGRVWFGVRRAPAWADMVHPEWSAQVWGRCRARMLSGPGGTGALHVEPGSVVAIRTDALYLTTDPHWHDDGKVGRLRVKAHREGPLPAPRSVVELLRLREGR